MGISVFVVDQERTFADALAARLEAEDDVEVVAAVHARTPAQCLIVGRHADVMLLDADLPERAAVRLCEELCGRDEPPRVVMLSFSSKPERIVDAVRAGAAAWVGKNEPLQHLLQVRDDRLQFGHRVGGQFLRLGQLVRVLGALLLQPLEPVQLELALR